MNPTIVPRLADPTYDRLVASMYWRVPVVFNMGAACADVAPADSVALVTVEGDGGGYADDVRGAESLV